MGWLQVRNGDTIISCDRVRDGCCEYHLTTIKPINDKVANLLLEFVDLFTSVEPIERIDINVHTD